MIRMIMNRDSIQDAASEYTLPASVVIAVLADGSSRLLDMDGAFFALSNTATDFLAAALTASLKIATLTVARKYHQEPASVQRDLTAFLAVLHGKKLLVRKSDATERGHLWQGLGTCLVVPVLRFIHAMSMSLAARANVLLSLAHVSIRTVGLHRAVGAWQEAHRAIAARKRPLAGTDFVDEVDAVVRRAAALHPLRTECKERSLACWSLLQAAGLPAQIVCGLDLYPLQGHCWCQLGARLLTDDPSRCEKFSPFFSY